jgi:hypothetical protein
MKYICNKCNKIFTKKYNYTKHIQRINPCNDNDDIESINHEINENLENNENNENILIENNKVDSPIINNNTCPYCFKKFFQKSNVKIHINNKSCKIMKEKNTIITNEQIMEKLKELLLQNQKIQEDHQKNMYELKELTESKKNITINNTTTNHNVNINIFSAGKEDLSRLTQEEIIKICTSGTYYPLVAAEIIHCNKNYPEFQNFLISNLRSTTGLVLINDNWISKPQEEILSNILQVDKKHVSSLIKDLKVDDKLQIKLESTKDEIDNNESKEHLKSKIKSKLYNASKMINKNKKLSLLPSNTKINNPERITVKY